MGALTVTVLLASVPRVTLPSALKLFPAVTVMAAAAMRGAANELAALTVSVLVPVEPSCVLPAVLRVFNKVLPVTERVPVGLGMARLPARVARPLLSMVRRSTSWLPPVLVLPVELVLKMRLPPSLPVTSCIHAKGITSSPVCRCD